MLIENLITSNDCFDERGMSWAINCLPLMNEVSTYVYKIEHIIFT